MSAVVSSVTDMFDARAFQAVQPGYALEGLLAGESSLHIENIGVGKLPIETDSLATLGDHILPIRLLVPLENVERVATARIVAGMKPSGHGPSPKCEKICNSMSSGAAAAIPTIAPVQRHNNGGDPKLSVSVSVLVALPDPTPSGMWTPVNPSPEAVDSLLSGHGRRVH